MPDSGNLTVGIVGAGRLGSAIALAAAREQVPVVLTATGGGWVVRGRPDVLIDASAPAALDRVADYCRTESVPLVECVSYAEPEHLARLDELARTVRILHATNLALGNHLQRRLIDAVGEYHQALEAEVGVRERHPVRKAPRPSATAWGLAARSSAAAARKPPEPAFSRTGGEVSDHEITWSWPDGESLTVRHSVGSLARSAGCALAAARWVRALPPGASSIDEVHLAARSDGPVRARPEAAR
jgi:4-hydroxy-tetrahydrodipicolinate reductase